MDETYWSKGRQIFEAVQRHFPHSIKNVKLGTDVKFIKLEIEAGN